MKTMEELCEKHLSNWGDYTSGMQDDVKGAMQEYAKQEANKFAEYLSQYYNSSGHDIWEDINNSRDIFSTEELYKIWKDDQ